MKPFSSLPLQLCPVTDYPPLGYPTVDGLDEALREDAVGYRFAAPAITSAVLAGLAGMGCSRSPATPSAETGASGQPSPTAETASTVVVPSEPPAQSTPPAVASATPEPVQPAKLEHPFSWEASQLPIEWHPYGTGKPMRLSEDKARAVIEEVFARAGVQLAKDTGFHRPGVDVELDGYDAQRRIGYEWVTWSDLEDPTGFRGKQNGKNNDDFSKMISHDEMKGIQSLEEVGKEHVIVVSYQDDRFAYPTWGRPDGGPGPESMESNLRAAVEQYVQWLKAQGAL